MTMPLRPVRKLCDIHGVCRGWVDTERAPQRLRPGVVILDRTQSVEVGLETMILLEDALARAQRRT
jgi:hypothetical protein